MADCRDKQTSTAPKHTRLCDTVEGSIVQSFAVIVGHGCSQEHYRQGSVVSASCGRVSQAVRGQSC
jgi:hypothetical protein